VELSCGFWRPHRYRNDLGILEIPSPAFNDPYRLQASLRIALVAEALIQRLGKKEATLGNAMTVRRELILSGSGHAVATHAEFPWGFYYRAGREKGHGWSAVALTNSSGLLANLAMELAGHLPVLPAGGERLSRWEIQATENVSGYRRRHGVWFSSSTFTVIEAERLPSEILDDSCLLIRRLQISRPEREAA